MCNQFSSVFSFDDGLSPEVKGPKAPAMDNIKINTTGIIHLLKELNPFKASGPDMVAARFLKETAEEIAPGLALLFQASLHQANIPNEWRDAIVTPL